MLEGVAKKKALIFRIKAYFYSQKETVIFVRKLLTKVFKCVKIGEQKFLF